VVKVSVLASILLSLTQLGSVPDRKPLPDAGFVTQVAVAPDGTAVAVSESFRTVSVVQPGPVVRPLLRLDTGAFTRLVEGPRVTGLSWSSDSRFLLIELADDLGEDFALVLIDRQRPGEWSKPVLAGTRQAAIGAWARSGHTLYACPDGREVGVGEGIYAIDAATRASRRIVSGVHVASDLSVGNDVLVAQVKSNESSVDYTVIQVDLRTHAVTKIFDRSPAARLLR
jgi:hypothetical protein